MRLLGGTSRPRAYNSNGLGLIGADAAAREAVELLEGGFTRGQGAPGLRRAGGGRGRRARGARRGRRATSRLMADYNQSLTVPEAVRRALALDGEALAWIEEPVRADDYEGCAEVARAARTPMQIGENCWGPHDLARAIRARSADLLMPDAMKIGGVTGWLRAAALTEAAGIPTSHPPLPGAFGPPARGHADRATGSNTWTGRPRSCASPWPSGGHVCAPDRPGLGLDWDEAAVRARPPRRHLGGIAGPTPIPSAMALALPPTPLNYRRRAARVAASFSSLIEMLRNCTSAGGEVHSPSFFEPWCCRAMRPRGGQARAAPRLSITVSPLSTTVRRLPPDRDLERVPLADVAVGQLLRRHARAHLGRHLVVDAVAVDLARADRPAPDVDLRLGLAAQVDAGVRVGHGHQHRLAVRVAASECRRAARCARSGSRRACP